MRADEAIANKLHDSRPSTYTEEYDNHYYIRYSFYVIKINQIRGFVKIHDTRDLSKWTNNPNPVVTFSMSDPDVVNKIIEATG